VPQVAGPAAADGRRRSRAGRTDVRAGAIVRRATCGMPPAGGAVPEPPRLRSRWNIIIGDGRQLAVKGLEFRVREECRRRLEVACGGSGKRFRPCRIRGNGRQGRHFHGEAFDRVAQCGAGLGQQRGLMEPQPTGPGGRRSQEDDTSVAHVREPRLARGRGGQQLAQSAVQRIQLPRPFDERGKGDAFRRAAQAASGLGWIAPWHRRTRNRCDQ